MSAEEYRLLQLLTPVPLDAAAAAFTGAAAALEEAGFEAYLKKETGLGMIWVRRKATQP